MKTRKILGIVVLTLVVLFAIGTIAYAESVEVSTEEEFLAAIQGASEDSAAPTEIVLKNDIRFTSSSKTASYNTYTANQTTVISQGGIFINGKYINFTGGHNLVKASKTNTVWGYNNPGQKAFMSIFGGEVTFDGVGIDMNASDSASTGGRALTIWNNGKVTVKNAEIINGDFAEQPSVSASNHHGLAAYIQKGTLVMGENSKITGFVPRSTYTASDIIYVGTGLLEIDGGVIRGNTVSKDQPVIFVSNSGGYISMVSGEISNNDWNGGIKRAVRADSGSSGAKANYLGGEMKLDGAFSWSSTNGYLRITSALNYPLELERTGGLAASKTDNNGNAVGLYSTLFAQGTAGYTLTEADLYKLSVTDDLYGLYLDPIAHANNHGYGNVFPVDAVKGYPTNEPEIIKKTPAIADVIEAETDANDAKRTLYAGETMTIAETNLLKSATIDATGGKVVIGETTVKGVMSFDEEGNIDLATSGDLSFSKATSETHKNQAFVINETIEAGTTEYNVTLAASGY